jgi:hypothetical protein
VTGPATGAPEATGPAPLPTAGPGGQAIAFGVLAALGAAVFGTSFGFGILLDGGRVGPGLLPMVLGLLLLLLAGVQLLVRLRRLRAGGEAAPAGGGTDVFGRTDAQRVRQLWQVVIALPVTVLLVPLLGFLPAFGLLVLFVSAVVERRPPLVALLVAAIAVAAGYGVFEEFLDVPLPTGLLGDLLGW